MKTFRERIEPIKDPAIRGSFRRIERQIKEHQEDINDLKGQVKLLMQMFSFNARCACKTHPTEPIPAE
jgi:hypothetical protein